jgi:hypothetical protein
MLREGFIDGKVFQTAALRLSGSVLCISYRLACAASFRKTLEFVAYVTLDLKSTADFKRRAIDHCGLTDRRAEHSREPKTWKTGHLADQSGVKWVSYASCAW